MCPEMESHYHTLRPSYFCSELSPSRYTSGSDYEMDWPQRLHGHETLRRNRGRVLFTIQGIHPFTPYSRSLASQVALLEEPVVPIHLADEPKIIHVIPFLFRIFAPSYLK